MGKQANGTDGCEIMEDRFSLPLFYLDFQKKSTEPILELLYAFLVNRCDYNCVEECPTTVRKRRLAEFSSGGWKIKCTRSKARWARNNFVELCKVRPSSR